MRTKFTAGITVIGALVVLLLSQQSDFIGQESIDDKELGTAQFSSKTKNKDSDKQVRGLERELTALNEQGNIVGPDHIQRLWQRLLDLRNKGALNRAKAEQLYRLLLTIYQRSNPQPTVQKTQPAQTSATASLEEVTKETKAEIDHIGARENVYLAKEHYKKLKERLDYLTSQGVTGLESYYALIEEHSPYAIAEANKQQEAERVERKKRQADSYYDCPANAPAPVLTADITDTAAIQNITAPGTPTGDRDVAKGHGFIWTGGALVSLYAPIDAVLDSGAFYKEGGLDQYTLTFRILNHCGYALRFDHVHRATEAIKNALNQIPQEGTQGQQPTAEVIVRAGEKIGETSGNPESQNWDFGFYNMAKKGALADSYGMNAYSVCWVDYYSSEKQPLYRSKLTGPKTVCNF